MLRKRAADQRDAAARRHARRARPIPSARRCDAKQVTATRPRRPRISADRLWRTSASLPEWPSTIALVESQIIASTPRSPSAAKAASSVGGPSSGCGIELPVAGVQQQPVRRVDHQRLRLRDRVRDAHEPQRERRQIDRAARRDDMQLHLVEQLHLGQLAPQHRGGERRGIDRTAQLRPQPGHGADVVLVRVGDDQPDQPVAPVGDEAPGRASSHRPRDAPRPRSRCRSPPPAICRRSGRG